MVVIKPFLLTRFPLQHPPLLLHGGLISVKNTGIVYFEKEFISHLSEQCNHLCF